jgi:four helix bundle protein
MTNNSSFRELKVWRDAMTLVEDVYKLSARFPSDERFGLTSQIRRAAVSIPSNIGEGKRRKRQHAFLNHLDIALGSQGKLEVQLEIAQRLGFVTRKPVDLVMNRVAEVGRMLNGRLNRCSQIGWNRCDYRLPATDTSYRRPVNQWLGR